MKFYSLILILFFVTQGRAFELQSGDVVIQSFDCMECRLIQDETNSPYVHSGLIVKDKEGVLKVAEALGPVGLTSVDLFFKRGTLNSVFRSKEIAELAPLAFDKFELKLTTVFFQDFWKLPFDSDFLWDNISEDGKDKVYCAEFVAKLLNVFFNDKIVPVPMSYKKNYELWKKIFRGKVPEGLPGLSPAYFSRSEKFIEIKQRSND